jgi:hypothetical protein
MRLAPIALALAVPLAALAGATGAEAAPSTSVVCQGAAQAGTETQGSHTEPRSCVFVRRGSALSDEANRVSMRSTRWNGWGRSAASGAGRVVGGAGDGERATLRLYGRITCGGERWYTRARLVYADDAVQRKLEPKAFKLQACAG